MSENRVTAANQSRVLQPETALTFECFGVKVKVSSNKREFVERARTILPVGAIEKKLDAVEHQFELRVRDDRQECVLYYNEREWLRDAGLKWTFDVLRSTLRQRVAENTTERVFVHAGAVAWRDQIILIPGDSFAGKTTLTAELVRAGAVYYSDEFAILDSDALVHPFQKPLSMRDRKTRAAEQTDFPVEHFRGVQGETPLPVGLVVITEYQPRARWQPEVLTAGNGALEILKHANNSLKHPEIVLPVLQKVAEQAKIIKTKRGDAARAARLILRETESK